ncbi:MAG: AEC family transporter [Clostridia bacterium]|nr:AEC family transporter [Clostridia bacterium]
MSMGSMYLKTLIIMCALAVFMVPGLILRKCKMIGEGGTKTLSNILLYVCQPAISINAFCVFSDADWEIIQDMSKLRLLRNFGLCIAISAAACLVVFGVCKLIFMKWKNRDEANIFTFVAVFSNCAFLGMPFVEAFTDGNALACIYVMVFNIVFLVLCWTLGVYLITGDSHSIKAKKILLHPSIIASAVALVLFFVPQANFFMIDAVKDLQIIPKYLAYSAAPISMIIVGIRLADVKMRDVFCDMKTYFASFLRLIAAPAITLAIGLLFKGLLRSGAEYGYEEFVYLAPVIAMAMAPASSVVAMAESCDGNTNLATCTFINGTIISVVIIPLTVSLVMMI